MPSCPFACVEELGALRVLDLSMPSCPFACVEELGALRVLDLSHNEVQAVEAKVFTFLTSLVKLNLAHNRISQISPDVFLQERGSSPL
jgi:hypothetical protein